MYLHNLSIVPWRGLQPGWGLSLWSLYRSSAFCLPGGASGEGWGAPQTLLKSSPHPHGSPQPPLPSTPFAPLQQHLFRRSDVASYGVMKDVWETVLPPSALEDMSLLMQKIQPQIYIHMSILKWCMAQFEFMTWGPDEHQRDRLRRWCQETAPAAAAQTVNNKTNPRTFQWIMHTPSNPQRCSTFRYNLLK